MFCILQDSSAGFDAAVSAFSSWVAQPSETGSVRESCPLKVGW